MNYENIASGVIIAVVGALVLLIVIGNVLVIATIWSDQRLRETRYVIYVSMALADLLLGCFVLPLSLANELMDRWVFGSVLCVLWLTADVLLCTASIINLCLISLDRYCLVSKPMTYRGRSLHASCIMAALAWVVALIVSLPSILTPGIMSTNSDDECRISDNTGYVIYSTTGSFFIPLLVVLGLNARIYCLAKRSRRGPVQLTDVHSASSRHARRRERKAALVLTLVVGAFVVCWLPFFTTYLIQQFCPACFPEKLFQFFFWLGYCNSAINPVIYTIFNRDIREALKRLCGTRNSAAL